MIHRVAASDTYKTSPADIRRHWTLRELHVAHLMLDFARDKVEEDRRQAEEGADARGR